MGINSGLKGLILGLQLARYSNPVFRIRLNSCYCFVFV